MGLPWVEVGGRLSTIYCDVLKSDGGSCAELGLSNPMWIIIFFLSVSLYR